MKVKALKAFSMTTLGNKSKGDFLELNENLAKDFIKAGLVEAVDVTPLSLGGEDGQPSSLSQAGQASLESKPAKLKKPKKKTSVK